MPLCFLKDIYMLCKFVKDWQNVTLQYLQGFDLIHPSDLVLLRVLCVFEKIWTQI